jgi:hypothetical protein
MFVTGFCQHCTIVHEFLSFCVAVVDDFWVLLCSAWSVLALALALFLVLFMNGWCTASIIPPNQHPVVSLPNPSHRG